MAAAGPSSGGAFTWASDESVNLNYDMENAQLLGRGKANSLRCATHQGALATQIQGQNMQVTHDAKGRQEAYF